MTRHLNNLLNKTKKSSRFYTTNNAHLYDYNMLFSTLSAHMNYDTVLNTIFYTHVQHSVTVLLLY